MGLVFGTGTGFGLELVVYLATSSVLSLRVLLLGLRLGCCFRSFFRCGLGCLRLFRALSIFIAWWTALAATDAIGVWWLVLVSSCVWLLLPFGVVGVDGVVASALAGVIGSVVGWWPLSLMHCCIMLV